MNLLYNAWLFKCGVFLSKFAYFFLFSLFLSLVFIQIELFVIELVTIFSLESNDFIITFIIPGIFHKLLRVELEKWN